MASQNVSEFVLASALSAYHHGTTCSSFRGLVQPGNGALHIRETHVGVQVGCCLSAAAVPGRAELKKILTDLAKG